MMTIEELAEKVRAAVGYYVAQDVQPVLDIAMAENRRFARAYDELLDRNTAQAERIVELERQLKEQRA
jgi:hypothetical protein